MIRQKFRDIPQQHVFYLNMDTELISSQQWVDINQPLNHHTEVLSQRTAVTGDLTMMPVSSTKPKMLYVNCRSHLFKKKFKTL